MLNHARGARSEMTSERDEDLELQYNLNMFNDDDNNFRLEKKKSASLPEDSDEEMLDYIFGGKIKVNDEEILKRKLAD